MLNAHCQRDISYDWKKIYTLPRLVSIDSYTRTFQYRLLNNILYLNKQLFKMKLVENPLCSYCKIKQETSIHMFSECSISVSIWNKLERWLSPELKLPQLTPQSAILGFLDSDLDIHDLKLINHILLIFKQAIYNLRKKSTPPNFFSY